MLTLLDSFAWKGKATSSLVTRWHRFPASYKNAELWVDTKLDSGGNVIGIDLQTSIDKTSTADAANASSASTPGVSVTAVTGLATWVRLKLSTNGAEASTTELSVWLIPKD